jgi:hypothetical protein
MNLKFATGRNLTGADMEQFQKERARIDALRGGATAAIVTASAVTTGIGAGRLAEFKQVLDGAAAGDARSARFLALGADRLVTTRGVVAFTLERGAGFVVTASRPGDEAWDEAVVAPAASGSRVTILARDAAPTVYAADVAAGRIALTPIASYAPPERGCGTPHLMGRDLYCHDETVRAWALLETNGRVSPVGLPGGAPHTLVLPATGDVLTAKPSSAQDAGGGCEWSRRRRAAGEAAAFTEVELLRAPCSSRVAFDLASASGALATATWSGATIRLQVWWPDR